MSLTIKKTSDKNSWDAFVSSSPQGNVFCRTAFLDSLDLEYDLVVVESDSCVKLGAIVLKQEGRPISAPYSYSMYHGVMYDYSFSALPAHSRAAYIIEITNYFLLEMERSYDCISFSLHHEVQDLRSFLWFHYHAPQHGQFRISLRYTGLLDLSSVYDFDLYLRSIRSLRLREYRRALANGLVIEETDDIHLLNQLHQLTFERQNIQRSDVDVRLLKTIAEAALARGFGELRFCRDSAGHPIAASLFLHDNRCGYYLIGANHPSYRNTGGGTLLMLEQIRQCVHKNLKIIDFIGVNSPQRGDYKCSFNAVPVPYHEIEWRRPLY